MRVVLTGADGFLGWHTRVRLDARTEHEVVTVPRARWADLAEHLRGADAVIHLAGVNRAVDSDAIMSGNVQLAQDLAVAIRLTAADEDRGQPLRVVFANSIQSGNGTPYGSGKQRAAQILAIAVADVGGTFADVLLPNIFGEHGRPDYNSFVATFVHAVARGRQPVVQDRTVHLLHVQAAAQALIEALDGDVALFSPAGTATSVREVLGLLEEFRAVYARSDIPTLDSQLRVDLFNTYRAALFPSHYPIALTTNADDRGRLVETVRAHGGQGQTFVSTTRPGVTRGDHYHLGKVERFVVLSGEATISLRRVFHDEVIEFDVSGEAPVVVDMPTLWVHNITNVGDTELTTLFWTHSLFDADDPDTFWQRVRPDPTKVTR